MFFPIDKPDHRRGRAAKFRGVHLAIVTADKDAPPDNPGYRVKVKIPTLASEEETFYARIAVPMAGKGRGTYMLPEVHDQVLVVFEHGHIDRPIIVGTLHSKQQVPAEINGSGKNNTKLIKSRSGHRLIFDDTKGSERITIVDSTGKNKIVLDAANKKVKIECAGDIVVKAKQNVILHANALKIGTTEGVSVAGKQVCMHAVASLGIKANQEITITGSQVTTNVTSEPACRVTGSGAGELGGVAEEQPKPQVLPDDEPANSGKGADARASQAGSGSSTSSPGANLPPIEPQPVLVSAAWSTDRTTVSTSVVLSAIAVDMAGQGATFTIRDADDPETVITTLEGTCDDKGVKASWTTPADAPPISFDFEVAAGGKKARSSVLVLVRKFEATLKLGDDPAARAAVRLKVAPSGEELHATADDDGVVRFPDAPFGDVTLFLEGG